VKDTQSRAAPIDQAGGYPGADELLLQEELDDYPAEILRHPLDVAEGDMDKLAPIVKPALHTMQWKCGFHRKNSPLVW